MIQTKQDEPPSLFRPPLFMVGQDERGNWVVQDLDGVCGGFFVSREAAMRYIRSENGPQPQAVVLVSGVLELDMTSKTVMNSGRKHVDEFESLRRIA